MCLTSKIIYKENEYLYAFYGSDIRYTGRKAFVAWIYKIIDLFWNVLNLVPVWYPEPGAPVSHLGWR